MDMPMPWNRAVRISTDSSRFEIKCRHKTCTGAAVLAKHRKTKM